VWTETKIEQITRVALVKEFGEAEGNNIFGLYSTARKTVVEQILPNIQKILPAHTDHGPLHVARVLNMIGDLIQIESNPVPLSSVELYCLILGAVFHDTGNIFGRENHQRNISKIYDFCRAEGAKDFQEKLALIKIVEAHCGKTYEGSNDTLKVIETTRATIFDRPVHLCKIAAILRFADELAEGKERTSLFMIRYHNYPRRSRIYHEYAKMTRISVDFGNERIRLSYDIEVKSNKNGDITPEEESKLKQLLLYCYQRISKVDQERQYTKHYCELLSKFRYTSVSFNFWKGTELININLPETYSISDLVVPGEKVKLLNERDIIFKEQKIIEKIKKSVKEGVK